MYQFTLDEGEMINGVLSDALKIARHTPHQISVAEDVARQVLIREILSLYRGGECEPEALAKKAVGLLRNHIQARESALRLSRPPEALTTKSRDRQIDRNAWQTDFRVEDSPRGMGSCVADAFETTATLTHHTVLRICLDSAARNAHAS